MFFEHVQKDFQCLSGNDVREMSRKCPNLSSDFDFHKILWLTELNSGGNSLDLDQEPPKMEETVTRGERIKAVRKKLGWSQLEVARYMGIGQTQISNAENDVAGLDATTWTAVMYFCDKVDIGLIRPSDKPEPKTEGTAE